MSKILFISMLVAVGLAWFSIKNLTGALHLPIWIIAIVLVITNIVIGIINLIKEGIEAFFILMIFVGCAGVLVLFFTMPQYATLGKPPVPLPPYNPPSAQEPITTYYDIIKVDRKKESTIPVQFYNKDAAGGVDGKMNCKGVDENKIFSGSQTVDSGTYTKFMFIISENTFPKKSETNCIIKFCAPDEEKGQGKYTDGNCKGKEYSKEIKIKTE